MQDCVRLTQTLQDITRDYQHDYCVSRTHIVLPCIAQTHDSQALTWRSLMKHSYTLVIRYIQKKEALSETEVVDCALNYLGIPKPRRADKNCLSIPLNDPEAQGIKYTSNSHTTVTLILGHKSRNIGNRTVSNNSRNTSDVKKQHSVSQVTISNEV